MTDVEFAPKEVIESGNRVVENLAAETTEQYGPQLAIKLKVVGGEHDGYTFTDYPNRDENTGRIKQGSKAWDIFVACLGSDFYKRGKGFQDLVGCRFMAQVSQTKTGSRNKLEHGTIGPAPKSVKEDLNDLPF
jgi:hypothetical protein